MNKTTFTSLALILTISLTAVAQNSIRMPDPYERLSKREKAQLQTQSFDMFNAASSVTKKAAAVKTATARIQWRCSGERRIKTGLSPLANGCR